MTPVFRKLLLLLLSLAVVGLVILSYQQFAGSDRSSDSQTSQSGPAAPIDWSGVKRIGSQDASLDRAEKLEYSRRGAGGRVERVYRAEVFDLESEDQARLEDVTFIWHLKNGQTITLTSDTGRVRLDRGPNRMQPTRGLLSGNVQILFQLPDDSSTSRPSQDSGGKLIITTDELEFDMGYCLLWTDRAVQLRGTDLDANGTGFQLRWREVSQEIDRLTIKEGGELTWRGGKGGAFGKLIDDPDGPDTGASAKGTSESPADGERIHSYLATFNEGVRIAYNDRDQVQTIRNIDCLNILFDMALSQEPDEQDTDVGPSAPAGKDTPTKDPEEAYSAPTLRLIWNGTLEVVPAGLQAEQMPLGGRLRFEALGSPLEFNTVDVSGSCANLQAQQDTGMVSLSSKEDVGVNLELSDGTNVTTETLIIDPPAKDSRLIRMPGKGNLRTVGSAGRQMGSDLEESDNVDVSWQESALLKLVRLPRSQDIGNGQGDGNDFYVADAIAKGRVIALSQKFTTKANMVHIELDPPGSDGTDKGQAIRVLRAKDQFSADLPTEKGELTVEADAMAAKFSPCSSGKGQYPSRIDLTGNVLATEQTPEKHGESRLQCGEMQIDLVENMDVTAEKNNGYRNADVSQVVARQNVIGRYSVKGQPRSGLKADKLVADQTTHTTTLYGWPAELNRGQNDRLTSDTIIITELGRDDDRDKDYILTSPGPGQMRLTFTTADESAPPALLGMEWSDSLTFDGRENKAVFRSLKDKKITGAILHSPTSSSQFAANELELYLQNKVDNKSREKEVLAEDVASAETFFKPMSDKTLKSMVMKGQAEVRSIEHPVGKPTQRLRAAFLTSDVLNYDIQHDKKDKKRQFYADAPGSLLLEDYRPTDSDVTTDLSAPMEEIERGKQRGGPVLRRVGPGQTAFEWKKSAKYYQDERTAVLTGDVHMVSMGYALTLPGRSTAGADSTKKSLNRTELWCQTFTVTFAESEAAEPDAAKPDFADLSAMDELKVELVEAMGDDNRSASLVSKNIGVEGAQKILYDRKAGEIVIEGSRKSRATVVYLDPQRRQWIQWTGKHARYDVATGQLKARGGTSRALYSN